MNVYDSTLWDEARTAARERDGDRCTVARFFGGRCLDGPLHVHHIHAVNEGGALFDLDNLGTTCAAHHPFWESLRRLLVARMFPPPVAPPRCTHRHVSAEARALCERQLARRLEVAA